MKFYCSLSGLFNFLFYSWFGFYFIFSNLRLLNSLQWEGLLKSNRAIVVNMISVFLRQF